MAEHSVALTDPHIPDPRLEPLTLLFEHWLQLKKYKDQLKKRLQDYTDLYEEQGWFPRYVPPQVPRWMLVRLIAETGPLDRFSHIRQLWSYLGLKLACRQSGKFKGHVKITKKGSALARKLLFQMCLPLVRHGGWLHQTHRRQNPNRQSGGKGIRAMTWVIREFIRVLFALQCNGQPLEWSRVYQSETRFNHQTVCS